MIILPSLEIVPAKYNTSTNTLLSQIPIDGTGDFTVSRTTSPVTGQSTRVNALGQIELVADNVPRLDYYTSGGTVGCPALLVEPSAKNFWLQSENLSSASWLKLQAGSGIAPTVSASTESLFGLPTFEVTFTPNGTSSGDTSTIRQGFTPDATGNHTQSWYIRSLSGTQQLQAFFASQIVQLTITETPTRITATSNLNIITIWNSGLTQVGTHTRTNGKFLITAAQMEAGSVATSYIPTTTAAVTRNADVVSVLGAVSGSIGQSEGTLYAEVDIRNLGFARSFINVQDSSYASNALRIESNASNQWRIQIRAATSGILDQTITSPTFTTGTYKIAMAYNNAASGVVFAVNGTIIYTNTSALTMPSAMNRVHLGTRVQSGIFDFFLNDRIRAAALYTTRLTDTQLALLTSPYTSYSSMASALSYTLG